MKSYYILAQPVGLGKEEAEEEGGGQHRYKVSSPPALLVEETSTAAAEVSAAPHQTMCIISWRERHVGGNSFTLFPLTR